MISTYTGHKCSTVGLFTEDRGHLVDISVVYFHQTNEAVILKWGCSATNSGGRK